MFLLSSSSLLSLCRLQRKMGFSPSLSHSSSLQFSPPSHGGEAALSSSKSTLFFGAPLSFSSSALTSLSGKQSRFQKRFVVLAKKFSALEEGMRIQRRKELETKTLFKRNLPVRPGRVSPGLPVPDEIPKPPYISSPSLPAISSEHQIQDSEGIARMRAACELAARVLEHAGTLVRPSVTTNEIDKAVHNMIIEAGAYPSLLGYGCFPKSVCTSVNECMCHGVPDSRQLQDGDIINIDVTVYLNGYHGDTSKTFLCGDVSDVLKRLVKVTEECLEKGIAACRAGAMYRKIGKRISEHAEKYGLGVVERFVGHGIGTEFHSEPFILHHHEFQGNVFAIIKEEVYKLQKRIHLGNENNGFMVEGQTFTIEPILTLGSTKSVTWPNNWTTVTADGSPAAQFGHTVLITKSGAEILTKC